MFVTITPNDCECVGTFIFLLSILKHTLTQLIYMCKCINEICVINVMRTKLILKY